MTKLKQISKRGLALLLTAIMLFSATEGALAYIDPNYASSGAYAAQNDLTLNSKDGAQIQVDSTWEETYPYGTFALMYSELVVGEGEEGVITVYRLGNATGRATVRVAYQPVLYRDETGNELTGSALSADDLTIEVEDPLSVAAYQPLNEAPHPEESSALVVTSEADDKGDVGLSLNMEGDAYQWYASADGIDWGKVEGATAAVMPVKADDLSAYDFRCVYIQEGTEYCTGSRNGVTYKKPASEVLEPMPDNLPLNEKPGFTTLDMTANSATEFDGWAFNMTFADGEWKKEIRLSALQDELVETREFATFTLVDHLGGDIYEPCSTLLLGVTDDEVDAPSQVGFSVTEATFDKSEGTAKLTVTRTGGFTKPLTVNFATEDGTALAGRDYRVSTGTLAFYDSVKELTVEIPLINDGVASSDQLDFHVVLSDLRGDNASSISGDRAKISLWNSGTGTLSLEERLRDGNAVDATGTATDSSTAANGGAALDPGVTQVDLSDAVVGSADVVLADDSHVGEQYYDYGTIKFAQFLKNNSGSMWKSLESLRRMNTIRSADRAAKYRGFATWTEAYGTGKEEAVKGANGQYYFDGDYLTLSGNTRAWMEYDTANFGKFFSRAVMDYYTTTQWTAKTVYDSGSYGEVLINGSLYPTTSMWRGTYRKSTQTAQNNVTNQTDTLTTSSSDDTNREFHSKHQFNYSMNNDGGLKLQIGWHTKKDPAQTEAYVKVAADLVRRTFTADNLKLAIYTANDGDTSAPVKLTEDNYRDIKPDITIVQGEGGGAYNTSQNTASLFVGTRLKITLPSVSYLKNFVPNNGTQHAVFLYDTTTSQYITSSNGYDENTRSYTLDLIWNGMSEAQLSHQYEVRVIMSRVSDVTLSLAGGRNPDTEPTQTALNRLKQSGAALTMTYSAAGNNNGTITYSNYQQTYTGEGLNTLFNQQGFLKWAGQTNLQSITLKLQAGDVIVYNGSAYQNGDTIQLSLGDMTSGITLFYYHKDFTGVVQQMTPFAERLSIYQDSNGNGILDGYKNSSGIFTLTPVETTVTAAYLAKLPEKGGAGYAEGENYKVGGKAYLYDTFATDLFDTASQPDPVNPPAFEDSLFAPEKLDYLGTNGLYVQYILKAYYSMQPRCITVPAGAQESDKAQVLLALDTAITDPLQRAKLTDEQRSYRYLVSGLTLRSGDGTGNLVRSSDDQLMFTAKATSKSWVDVPLGGDYSPPMLNDPDKKPYSGDEYYTWSPSYHGNLLYAFENPQPISIEKSVAGETPVTKDVSYNPNGSWSYTRDGKGAINRYLGALVGDQTLVMVTQEQKHTVPEILRQVRGIELNTDLSDEIYVQDANSDYMVTVDGVQRLGFKTFQNADYVQNLGGSSDSGNTKPNGDTGGSGNTVPEFDLDLKTELPSFEIGATDFLNVTVDGYEVGFSVGIPLLAYEKENDKAGEKKHIGNKFEDFGEDMGTIKKFFTSGAGAANAAYKEASRANPSYNPSDPNSSKYANDRKLGSKNFSVSLSVSFAFLFKYNPLDNTYYFEQFSVSAVGALSFRLQYRFSVAPIIYVYLQLDVTLEIGTGLGVNREAVLKPGSGTAGEIFGTPEGEGGEKSLVGISLAKGKSLTFSNKNYNALLFKFSGKFSVGYLNTAGAAISSGYDGYGNKVDLRTNSYSSRGGEDIRVVLAHTKSRELYADEDKTTPITVKLTAKENVSFTAANYVADAAIIEGKSNLTQYPFDFTNELAQKSALSGLSMSAPTTGATGKINWVQFSNETYKAFALRFSGKVNVMCFHPDGTQISTGYDGNGQEVDLISGFLVSDGSEDVQVILAATGSMKLYADQARSKPIVVRLIAMNEVTVDAASLITEVRSDVYWLGLRLAPNVALELGAGIGIDILKIELFVKVTVGLAFTLGRYNPQTSTYDPASFDSFDLTAGIGFRIVLLVLTYELDAITYILHGENINTWQGGGTWTHGWKALNGAFGEDYEIKKTPNESAAGQSADENLGAVLLRVTLPGDASGTQVIYTPEDNKLVVAEKRSENTDEVDPQAYDPYQSSPFQLSGYGVTAAASMLMDGTRTGYDYKLIAVGERSLVLYTAARAGNSPLDGKRLVLSELVLNQKGAYTLCTPGTTKAGYLEVDNDQTGDLDFSATVQSSTAGDVTTHNVQLSWVSYDTATGDLAPKSPPPNGMDKNNYTEARFRPAEVTAPTTAKPGSEPAVPTESDYFTVVTMTEAAFGALEQGVQAHYSLKGESATTGSKDYYHFPSYDSKAAADAALKDAQDARALWDAWVTYETYQTANSAYLDWYAYFAYQAGNNDSYLERFQQAAAKNTVVKESTYTVKATKTTQDSVETVKYTFPATVPAPTVLRGKGSYVFQPVAAGKGVFYGVTTHMTDKEMSAADAEYLNFLKAAGEDPDTTDGKGSPTAEAMMTQFKQRNRTGLNALFGKGTSLAYGDGTAADTQSLSPGQTLQNMVALPVAGESNAYYLLYTTSNTQYEKISGGAFSNEMTNLRLYIRKVTVSGSTVNWGKAYLLRSLHDYEFDTKGTEVLPQNFTRGIDGRYRNDASTLISEYSAPYLAGLRALSGKLDRTKLTGGEVIETQDEADHDFFLFEMNGATYILLDEDLATLTGGGSNATIYPFFTGKMVSSADKKTTDASGKTEVVIGSDPAGNLYAVYVAAVKNTTNNALFVSAYDSATNSWGDGVMLAMRNMDIYEKALAQEWDDLKTQNAYYDVNQNGTVDSDLAQFTFSNLQTGAGADGRLLVLSQGTLLPLTHYTFTKQGAEDKTMVMRDTTRNENVGIYAIGYGVGSQRLSKDKITFGTNNFSSGSPLFAALQFTNTGDVAFRADDEHPLTISLYCHMAAGGSTLVSDVELAQWTRETPIYAGTEVTVGGACKPLIRDLSKGSYFYISVAEDAYYGSFSMTTERTGGSVTDGSGKYTTWAKYGTYNIEERAELAVEDLAVTRAATPVNAQGNSVFNLSFRVTNRGDKAAESVFVQLTRWDGKYWDGINAGALSAENTDGSLMRHYVPLKLESGTEVTFDKEEITDLADTAIDYNNGKLSFGSLEAGWQFTVPMKENGVPQTARIVVAPQSFAGSITGSLDLRAEVFSATTDTQSMEIAGLSTAEHSGEYNSDNNRADQSLEPASVFISSTGITFPLGSVMELPLTVRNARGGVPNIQVEELADTSKELAVLYYDERSSGTGSTTGALMIEAQRVGSGVIQVRDLDTSAVYPIAYSVTEAGEGVNIYKDNAIFSFFNSANSQWTESSVGYQGWEFQSGIGTWGTPPAAPYLGNLSKGNKGSYFTFTTTAQKIDLSFSGTVSVVSSLDSGKVLTGTASGGSAHQEFTVGDDFKTPCTVTVTVTSDVASFDTVKLTYTGDLPIPKNDGEKPILLWSRSFPQTQSIQSGTSPVALTVWVMDNLGLGSLSVNGEQISAEAVPGSVSTDAYGNKLYALTRHSETLWSFKLLISGNTQPASYKFLLTDRGGNSTVESLTVDWFTTAGTPAAGRVSTVPELSGGFYLGDNPLSENTVIPKDEIGKLHLRATSATDGATVTGQAASFTSSGEGDNAVVKLIFTNLTDTNDAANAGQFTGTNQNGYYLVRAAKDGTWRQSILPMDRVDNEIPSLIFRSNGTVDNTGRPELFWQTSKTGRASKITDVTLYVQAPDGSYTCMAEKLNKAEGYELSGTFPVSYGGGYQLVAKDASGNEVRSEFALDSCPIVRQTNAVTVTDTWGQTEPNGSILIDMSAASMYGGRYDRSANTNWPATPMAGFYQVYLLAFQVAEEQPVPAPAAPVDADGRTEAQWRAYWSEPMTTAKLDILKRQASMLGQSLNRDGNKITLTAKPAGSYLAVWCDSNAASDAERAKTATSQMITIAEKRLSAAAIPMDASDSTAKDGSVLVTAAGGLDSFTGYQFAIFPIEDEKKALTTKEISENTDAVWQFASDISAAKGAAKFEGLKSGWYQFAVRSTINESLSALAGAQQTYLPAKAALEIAKKNRTAEGQSALVTEKQNRAQLLLLVWQNEPDSGKDAAWSNLRALYTGTGSAEALAALEIWKSDQSDAKKADYERVAAACFTAQTQRETETALASAQTEYDREEPLYRAAEQRAAASLSSYYATTAGKESWKEIYTATVFVDFTPPVYSGSPIKKAIKSVDTNRNGALVYTLTSPTAVMSTAELTKLRSGNKLSDCVLYAKGVSIFIPKGVLTPDFNANLLVIDPKTAAAGSVVAYTGADGKAHIQPWCVVTPDGYSYVVSGLGKYSIIQNSKKFGDLTGHWSLESSLFNAVRELFGGTGNDSFSPDLTMTRAMFATVLYRLDGEPGYQKTSAFTDLTQNWYIDAVHWAAELGIMDGYSAARFGPDDQITREQMCAVFARYLTARSLSLPAEPTTQTFPDLVQVHDWARQPVAYCVSSGLIQGIDGSLKPLDKASRGEVATLFTRLVQKVIAMLCTHE